MKIKVNTLLVFALFLGLFFMVFIWGYVVAQRKGDRQLNTIELRHSEEIKRYSVMLDSQDVVVAEKNQEILSQREAIRNSQIEKEELRKLNIKRVNEITRLKLRIDTLLTIKPDTNIFVIDTCDGKPVLPLPYSFSKKDEYLTLDGTIDTKGVVGLGIAMEIPLDLWCGVDKTTKLPKATLTTPNRYVQTLDIRSIKFDLPKPKKNNISLFIGYGIGLKGKPELEPVIAIGFGKSIARF